MGLHEPAILAVLLATSSGAVALPVLQALDRNDRAILVTTAWIAMADVVTVLVLPLVLANGRLGRVLLGSALVALTGAVLLLVARAVRRQAWARRLRVMSHERGWGLDLRVSLLALFVCAWLASRFGTSILIAGFTVGAIVALLGEPRRVAQQLVGLGEGFAIPLFFVHLGAQHRSRRPVRVTESNGVGREPGVGRDLHPRRRGNGITSPVLDVPGCLGATRRSRRRSCRSVSPQNNSPPRRARR